MKLHLGCGQLYLQGYINIDLPTEMHSVQEHAAVDLHANILELQYPENSISEIRLHHVFEHFTRPIALALISSWSSWLKPGGLLHIEVPDFYRQAFSILNHSDSFSQQALGIRHLFGSHEASWAVHCEGYSPQTLQFILHQYGYSITEIHNKEWQQTYSFEVIACKNTETRTKATCFEISRNILLNYLLDSTEYRLLEIWLEMYSSQVEKTWATKS